MSRRHPRGVYDAVQFDPQEQERRREIARIVSQNVALLKEQAASLLMKESMGGNAGVSADYVGRSALNFLYDAKTGSITYIGNTGEHVNGRVQEKHEAKGTAVFVDRSWKQIQHPDIRIELPLFDMDKLLLQTKDLAQSSRVINDSFATYTRERCADIEKNVENRLAEIHGKT